MALQESLDRGTAFPAYSFRDVLDPHHSILRSSASSPSIFHIFFQIFDLVLLLVSRKTQDSGLDIFHIYHLIDRARESEWLMEHPFSFTLAFLALFLFLYFSTPLSFLYIPYSSMTLHENLQQSNTACLATTTTRRVAQGARRKGEERDFPAIYPVMHVLYHI